MEARVLLVCLFVAAIVRGEQAPAGLCRSNERLLECGCPRTCRDPAPDCKAVCRTGCFCEEGQVRNDEGICVNLADCPPILSAYKQDTTEPRPNGGRCPENEEYRYCEPCNKTCDNPNPICPAQCTRGCFCKNGLLRDKDGSCVPPEKCSNSTALPSPNTTQHEVVCGKHQVYKRCEKHETRTCTRPNPRVPGPCAMGCFCQEGYVKGPNGQCIKFEDCPKGTGKINVTTSPVNWLGQPSNQTKVNSTNVGPTTPDQVEFQLLIDPMVHDPLPSLHDPTVEDCSPDEEYFFCGWCEPSCSTPLPICSHKVCMRGCQCRQPLLRHHSGRCVEAKDCFPENCNNPNEEFVCLFGCELRCDGRPCVQPQYCVLGCYCKIGYLRDTTGLCVQKDRCTNSTEIKGVAVNLKKKLSNDDKVYKTLTWRSLDELV